MNWILQFVLKQFAKKSARKTGITKLLKASDPIVQLNVRNITIKLQNMGINPKNLTSTDDVLNAMNYHNSLMNQQLKQQFGTLDLGKGVKSLGKKEPTTEGLLKGEKYTDKQGREWDFGKKKDPFQGWTPEVVEGGGLAPENFIRVRNGFSTAMKLNTKQENKQMVKEFIHKQNDEFNSLNTEQRKEVLDMVQTHMRPKKPDMASGGIARTGYFAGFIAKGAAKAGMGKFTKSEVLIKMMENTLKGSKSSYVNKNFPNMIKELTKNPELANNPKVWNFFTNKLPKNQRLVVHSDDSVDFWTQSDFGPHNIETTNKFMKKHGFTRDEAVRIQNMSPEDQTLEMKRLETIRNRTKQASGGIAGQLHLNRPGYKSGLLAKLFKFKKKPKPKSNRLSEQDVAALKKKHGLDPESLKKDEEAFKLRLQQILAKHSTKHAKGGRVSYTKGGLAHVLGV